MHECQGKRDIFITLLTMVIVLIAAISFWRLVNPLIVGISVAIVLIPFQRRLAASMNCYLSSALITVSVFIVAFFAIFSTLTILVQNAGYLQEMIGVIIEWLRSLSGTHIHANIPFPEIQPLFNAFITDLEVTLLSYLTMVPMMVVEMIIFFLTVYFLLVTGDRIWADIKSVIPMRSREAFRVYAKTVSDTLYSILVVHISIAVITFFLAIPFFSILGYEHVVFFSVLSGLFAVIPLIGPVFLIVFLGVYALALGDWRGLALLALIGYPVVCGLPDLYLRPVLMGRRIEIRPVLIFMAFFGGMAVMGVMGFILGPLLVALLLAGYRVMVAEYGNPEGVEGAVDTGDTTPSPFFLKVPAFLRHSGAQTMEHEMEDGLGDDRNKRET
ncbi:AI-2E family transporter [Methanofollis aquaemaris]|uniref:AI-2E family transporter n=1 Tax=Methanofollis aquaemaris TaxID=126734 RepID=A0A8A3S8I8_9EURY|nr:AI-2E family transporter [Methanofollis aquaemaris]QSZ68223.1 AI-2E family transporter [Methanofollis aquaemaris]